jgi:hypothetical protein
MVSDTFLYLSLFDSLVHAGTARATRTRWEVARVWRLGRRQYILYADPEDPYED